MAHNNIDERRKAVAELQEISGEVLKDLALKFGCSTSAIRFDYILLNGLPIKKYYKYDAVKSFERTYRKPIFDRDGYECKYCGSKDAKRYIIEHIIPVSKGGKNNPENLVVACSPCNYEKGVSIWVPKNFMEISLGNLEHMKYILSHAVKDFRQ